MQNIEETGKKAGRITWVTGMRGIAISMVALHHFYLACYSTFNIKTSKPNSYWILLFNGHFAIHYFFLLPGRLLTLPYLRKGYCLSSYEGIARGFFRRPFRLFIPAFGAFCLHILLQIVGAYGWVDRASAIMKAPGSRIGSWWREPLKVNDFFDVMSFIGWFFSNSVTVWFYPNGVLWTVPLFLMSSWIVYGITITTLALPKNRFLLYFTIAFFYWFISTWYYLPVVGLWLADASRGDYFAKLVLHTPRVRLMCYRFVLLFMFFAFAGSESPFYLWAQSSTFMQLWTTGVAAFYRATATRQDP